MPTYNCNFRCDYCYERKRLEKGGEWLEQMKAYLDGNFRFVESFLAEHLPQAEFRIPEATYLAWVNLSRCLPDVMDLPGFFANEAGVLLEGGNSLFPQAVAALRRYALSYLFAGFSIALAGYFAALGRGTASVVQSIGRGFVLLPGALLVLMALTGGTGIWWAALAGEALSLGLGVFLLRKGEIP